MPEEPGRGAETIGKGRRWQSRGKIGVSIQQYSAFRMQILLRS